MQSICFRVHLKNGVEINFVECGVPEGETECFMEWLVEAQETGLLEIGTKDTHMFIIPMENVAFIERIPDFEDDEE